MVCNFCGTQLADNAPFCPNCGASFAQQPTSAAYTQPTTPTPTYNAYNVYDPCQSYNASLPPAPKSILVFGILSLVFACTVYFAFVGIIFAAIALGKASSFYHETGGQIYGTAKVGRILAKIGLPICIVLTSIFLLAFMIGFFSAL